MRSSYFKPWFSFSRRERRAIIVLLVLIALCSLLRYALPFLVKQEAGEPGGFREEVEAFRRQIPVSPAGKTDATTGREAASVTIAPPPVKLFYFDPNTVSPDEWKMLGMEERTIRVIGNYLAKGGRFYRKEDVMKIYGLKKEAYERIAPYIRIGKDTTAIVSARRDGALRPAAHGFRPGAKHYGEEFILEINTADTAELVKLKGIGPVLAGRIALFRERLGGFYSVEQVGEVYGLPDSVYRHIKAHLTVRDSLLRKININEADVNTLKQHPYISVQLANVIVQYRSRHGVFSRVEELTRIALVDEEIYRKIAPYLTVE